MGRAARAQAARPDFEQPREEGQTLRLGGVLEIDDAPLQAPFSGRAAAIVIYDAHPFVVDEEEARRREAPYATARVYGRMLRRCWLRTPTQRLALQGFPCAPPTLEWRRTDADAQAACARHLARAPIEVVPDPGERGLLAMPGQLRQGLAELAQLQEPGELHRCNEIAAKLLGLPAAAAGEAALRERLRRARPSWIFHEHAWLPGQRVTAVGTWRMNPPHLDIGCGPRHPAHALLPGLPAQHARRELVAAVVFTLVLGGLTALGHYALRHDDGAWVRRALELWA